jgi:hypothetical protein
MGKEECLEQGAEDVIKMNMINLTLEDDLWEIK